MRDLFLGTWQLIPELSMYESGTPPASGIYEITEGDGGIRFRVRWTISRDGMLLAVLQEARGADGQRRRDFQVYRRAGSQDREARAT